MHVALPIAVLGLFIFAIWYTPHRLHMYFPSIPFWALQISTALLAISASAASLATLKLSNKLAGFMNIIGGYVLLFFIYLFFLLIFLRLIQNTLNFPFPLHGATALALALIVTAAGAVMGEGFVVRETKVIISGLEKELTVMHISDVHIGHHRGRKYLAGIVEETNKRAPDLVVITGDLADAEPALLPGALDPLSDFTAPVYFVEGNHEEYLGSGRVLKIIEQQGVRVLRNNVVETHGIQVIGIGYMKADESSFDMHPSNKTDTVKSVLGKLAIKKGVPSILLHHSPVGSRYAEAAGINLMLSGHTHGGQIFPFSLLSKIFFPFHSGMYQQGNTKVFVSNGAGTFLIRVRLGSFNEINLVKLVPDV